MRADHLLFLAASDTWQAWSLINVTFGAALAYCFNLIKENKTRAVHVDSVLAAMQVELQMMGEFYDVSVGQRLSEFGERGIFGRVFSHTRNYFIVYPANTSIIGQANDQEVITAIVSVHNTANNLIEFLEMNNALLKEWQDLIRDEKRGQDRTATERRQHQEDTLRRVYTRLTEAYGEYRTATTRALANISRYRSEHPVKRLRSASTKRSTTK